MDKTPSLTRALVGLTLLIAAIAGGYLALKWGSDKENEDGSGGTGDEIRFVRSGGFTGQTTTVVLQEDGRVRLETPEPGREAAGAEVAPRRIDRIFAAIEESDWPDREELYPPTGCADCYQYDITYRGTHVRLFEPVPAQYERVTRMLSRLVDRL